MAAAVEDTIGLVDFSSAGTAAEPHQTSAIQSEIDFDNMTI
jgi:hypothetical protein